MTVPSIAASVCAAGCLLALGLPADASATEWPAAPITLSDSAGIWSLVPPPTGRYGHAAAYDPSRDRMIVFGGSDNDRRQDTWVLPLSGEPQWNIMVTSRSGPSVRYRHSAIYDPVRDRLVIFGGDNGSDLNDVWALPFDDLQWTKLDYSGERPDGREKSTAIYDPIGDRMIIYGGVHRDVAFDDVWAFSLVEPFMWIRLAETGVTPPGRAGHTAVYDDERARMVVFGGSADTLLLNDAWELSLGPQPAWSEIAAPAPFPGRHEHAAVYDVALDRMVIYGGLDDEIRDDAWALSFAGQPAWSQLTIAGHAAPAHRRHTAIYDPVRSRMVVFGGYTPYRSSDTWALSLSDTPAWSDVVLLGTAPSPRDGHTAIIDPHRDRMIVFGGEKDTEVLNESWQLMMSEPRHWSKLRPAGDRPPPRRGHSGIYDHRRDRMIVFGGHTSSTVYGDIWALEVSDTPKWAPLEVQGDGRLAGETPAARTGHSAIYDPILDRMIVFGGWDGNGGLNDVWALSLEGVPTWSRVSVVGGGPSPRTLHGVIFDPVRNAMLVFGGYDGDWLHDIWQLSFDKVTTWSRLADSGAPENAYRAIYDPIRDRAVGLSTVDRNLHSANVLSLANPFEWIKIDPQGLAPSIGPSGLLYDPIRDRMMFFGGSTLLGEVLSGDTWALSWAEPVRPQIVSEGYETPSREVPLVIRSVVSNPLAGRRAVEWSISSDRAWPGLPLAGIVMVEGAAMETLAVEIPLPDTAAAGPNMFHIDAWFSGALGNHNTCDVLVDDVTTSTLASLVSAEVDRDRARLTWFVSTSDMVHVQRREAGAPWSTVGAASPHGGFVVFEDADVGAGRRLGYRLAWIDARGEVTAGEVWLDIPPALGFALHGVRPNPASEAAALSFALPAPGRVAIEIFDVGGRRLLSKERQLDAGLHLQPIESGRLSPGVYLVRLTVGARSLETRMVVIE